jgi:hypothetical protein
MGNADQGWEALELNYNPFFFLLLYRKSWILAFLELLMLQSWKLCRAYIIEFQPSHRRERNLFFN